MFVVVVVGGTEEREREREREEEEERANEWRSFDGSEEEKKLFFFL